jgi:hypothetical protein
MRNDDAQVIFIGKSDSNSRTLHRPYLDMRREHGHGLESTALLGPILIMHPCYMGRG